MKVLFEHAEKFEYSLINSNKIKKYDLKQIKSNSKTTILDCIVAKICLQTDDDNIALNQLCAPFSEISNILKNKRFVIFPFAHLDNNLLNRDSANKLILKIKQALSKKFEIILVPFGYDKAFEIKIKGHSYNIMFREVKLNKITPEIYNLAIKNKDYNNMLNKISQLTSGKVYEIGVGTGLLTKQILSNSNEYFGIDIDSNFVNYLKANGIDRIICDDAITYNTKVKNDCIVMSLAYHHIKDSKKDDFIKKCKSNLKTNGEIIIGDVFLKEYHNEIERNKQLKIFHNSRINNTKNKYKIEMEKEALQNGLKRFEEFKTDIKTLTNLLKNNNFKTIRIIPIGNQDFGGYNIVVAKK